MGTSTDAILFYGYIWEGEYDTSRGEDFIQARLLESVGFDTPSPWDEAPKREAFETKTGYGVNYDYKGHQQAITKWKKGGAEERLERYYVKRREALEKASHGVELGYHCSGSCPMMYLAVKAAHLQATRGYPVALHLEHMSNLERKNGQRWRDNLLTFADNTDVTLEDALGPRWFLCSWWSS